MHSLEISVTFPDCLVRLRVRIQSFLLSFFKSQGLEGWAPAATCFIAYAPTFFFPYGFYRKVLDSFFHETRKRFFPDTMPSGVKTRFRTAGHNAQCLLALKIWAIFLQSCGILFSWEHSNAAVYHLRSDYLIWWLLRSWKKTIPVQLFICISLSACLTKQIQFHYEIWIECFFSRLKICV